MPLDGSSISFSDVLSSTPLPQYGDPRNIQPLDLSASYIEESPLDYSLLHDGDEPLNLVVKIPQAKRDVPKIERPLNFICRDKSVTVQGLFCVNIFHLLVIFMLFSISPAPPQTTEIMQSQSFVVEKSMTASNGSEQMKRISAEPGLFVHVFNIFSTKENSPQDPPQQSQSTGLFCYR